MRRRVLILISAVVLAAAAVTGVIVVRGSSGPELPVSADVAVTAARGATVRLASATLVIPPGAISANGRIAARIIDSRAGTDLGQSGKPEIAKPLISSAGQAVSFELTGARLIHPVTLMLSVSSAALAQAARARISGLPCGSHSTTRRTRVGRRFSVNTILLLRP